MSNNYIKTVCDFDLEEAKLSAKIICLIFFTKREVKVKWDKIKNEVTKPTPNRQDPVIP